MATQPKLRIGDQLLDEGLISQTQLEVALNEQRRAWRPLGEIMVSLGFVRESDLASILAANLGLELVRAKEIDPDPLLLASIDRDFVRESGSFPIAMVDGSLRIAMVNPDDPSKVSEVRTRFPYPLQLCVTTEAEIGKLLKQHLRDEQARVRGILETLGDVSRDGGARLPIEDLCEALLLDGIHRGATDIHVEPDEVVTRVRYRVDGILSQGENLPKETTDAVISRIKVMSKLDISERRRPQDGRMRVVVDGRNVDLRVSVMPTTCGENIVLRVLDTGGGVLRLEQLGIAPHKQSMLEKIGARSHGLFLVTGPTGSGKTTTLYSMLSTIDAMERNVATVEDPIEYRMPLLRQSQVEPTIGYTFNEGLRSLLRQDPDVVLVGEIRDSETAEMAIKASMTGHLVFSTLHTNSAIGAIPRLCDLGIDPFLIEDALIGVLAQRLVRAVCDSCAIVVNPNEAELAFMGGDPGDMKRGAGCVHCGGSGYSGRAAICELFLPDDAMADVLRKGADLTELRELAYASGYEDMTSDGKLKVRQGVTTIEEVLRVNRSHRLSEEERENV